MRPIRQHRVHRDRVGRPLGRAGRLLAGLCSLVLALATLAPRPTAASVDPAIYRGWTVESFDIRGLPDALPRKLAPGLALAQKSGGFFGGSRAPFDPRALDDDLRRATLFLARSGYPRATVTPEFEPDAEHRSVRVTLAVEPGAAVVVRDARTEAMPPGLEPLAAKVLRLEPGEVFTDWEIDRRVGELLRILQENGHAQAAVRADVSRPDSVSARITFVVNAGPVFHFGRTIVEGAPADLEEVTRRSAAIRGGDVYSLEDLERADESLRLLGLFRRVNVRTQPAGPDILDVVVTVGLAPPRSLNLGVGYWTVDNLRVEAAWQHRNLFRAGRGFGADASYSPYEQSAGIQLWKPVLFHSRTRGAIALHGRRETEESYELRSGDLDVSATYLATLETTWAATISLSVFDFVAKSPDANADGLGPNLLSLSLQWTRDTLDDHLLPRAGLLARVELEPGLPSFDFAQRYELLTPQVSTFAPGPGGTTFAARGAFGIALEASNASELLANKRYYAGGTGSMRGYTRRALGPQDAEGRPTGGVAKLELSTEIRIPLAWRFSGAAFLDAGQVWESRSAIGVRDLRFAVGPGLLVMTPVGPVRLDVGFPVGARTNDPPSPVYLLSVGQVF
ncbi:MAG: BamA/TamA family outer membrane protein [Gemmatimonadetes bacterium]|nr:BamA/TamA family outer membrane protein [Gemmatimonadota bacterium]